MMAGDDPMKKQSPPLHLEISRFDSTTIQAVFPDMTTFQLEPGPIEGWIRSVSVGDFQINSGTLSRAVLYNGHFTRNRLHFGFIMDPESSAIVHGHEYNAGTLAIDVGHIPIHETFPPHMIWVSIHCPKSFLLRELKIPPRFLKTSRHLTLTGARDELTPLIQLTQRCLNGKSGIPETEAWHLSTRFLKILRDLLAIRLNETSPEVPYAEGDKFLMHLIEISHQLAKEAPRRILTLDDICQATGIKRRTLQKYFHTLYGMGPTEYFRIRRLNGARADLLKGTAKVHEVAHRWKFTHMGRFSVRYKTHFGESPSQTLGSYRITPVHSL